jgi:cytochrome c556
MLRPDKRRTLRTSGSEVVALAAKNKAGGSIVMLRSPRLGRGRCYAAPWAVTGAATVVYALFGIVLVLPSYAQEAGAAKADGRPLVSLREVMEKTITPATNTIWNAFEPPTSDEQWLALEEAAVTLLVASNVVAIGGTGPMDDEWAQHPAWKAFNQVMINAAQDALTAIRARDHDALLTAADVMYPPCEGCHLQFNPGVVGAE